VRTFVVALMTASFVLPLALDASAQQRDTQTPRETQRSTDRDKDDKARAAWTKPAGVMESKRLVGAKIRGSDGKDLGEVEQLMVNEDGKVSHVVISKGGFAGVGGDKLVVPWSALRISTQADRPMVTIDSAALDRAQRYEARDRDRDRDRAPAASPGTSPSTSPRPGTTAPPRQ